MEQVEALMMCSIVDDLMTKLNNLTNGELVLSSVIFDVGNQDETKTALTIANHIRAYVAPLLKKHKMLDKSVTILLTTCYFLYTLIYSSKLSMYI